MNFQAAKFGFGVLDFYNPGDFVAMRQALKVLNSVRFYEIGITSTYSEFPVSKGFHVFVILLRAVRVNTCPRCI